MKNVKYLVGFFVICLALTVGACSDDDDYTPGEPAADGCMNVSFAESNATSLEVDPASPTFTIVLLRPEANNSSAANVPLTVLKGAEYFTVPATADFAAGATETQITVSASSSAPTGEDLMLEISITDEKYANPYSEGLAYYGSEIILVKWNPLGKVQFQDGFMEYIFDVTLEQRDDNPSYYRINFPYTNEALTEVGGFDGMFPASSQNYLVFEVKGQNVTWNKFWYTNLKYQGVDGQDIKAYLPSARNPSAAADDDESFVTKDEEGNILYFTLTPEYYVDGLGGFGLITGYLGFPGVDLESVLP